MNDGTHRAWWWAVAAVAATYVYFLIFAEFAFLRLVQSAFTEAGTVKRVMAGLGLGGVAGSVVAAKLYAREGWRHRLAAWFGACALAALLAAGMEHTKFDWPVWAWIGAIIGLVLGGLTVTLAAGLRMVSGGRLGVVCGVGTGIGYAFCNLPPVFTAGAGGQCRIAAGVAALGALVCLRLRLADAIGDAVEGGWKRWLLILAALVWMDSAAFAVIQHEATLRAATWTSQAHLWAYAVLHLLAAAWAGWALQLRFTRWVALAAWVLLAIACGVLAWSDGAMAGNASWPYVAAVSFYSAVLVYVPARSGNPRVAAAVYALAGWIGSALGIGMAQDLTGIPGWLVPVSGSVVIAAFVWRRGALRGMLAVLVGLAAVLVTRAGDVARGREVYIAEGCIHCHSQYVRPGTQDVEWWGPVVPLSESLTERPPLYGNRRQGPDLANVGLRRSEEWNRLHLTDPRSVSPGSRMPSYAYLFSGDGMRGRDLLAYLGSLGDARRDERMAAVATWRPGASVENVTAIDARRLFAGLCAACHGSDGRGNGPLAAKLAVPPPDFGKGWRRPLADDADGLARVVKFGLPGTAMAGHETLTDAEAVSLARLVASLHADATSP